LGTQSSSERTDERGDARTGLVPSLGTAALLDQLEAAIRCGDVDRALAIVAELRGTQGATATAPILRAVP